MTTTTALPPNLERSLKQRMDALKVANGIRTQRARLKRDMKAGRRDGVAMLLEPPDWLKTAKVFDLLLAMPKVGRVRANNMLVTNGVSPSKTVGGLSPRQRQVLVDALGRKGLR